nr:TonB-dependent receptor [uncultured Steroidobacter sp.]
MKCRKSMTNAGVALALLSASAVSAQVSAGEQSPAKSDASLQVNASSVVQQPIASQSLSQALDEFATRTKLQVVYRSDIAARVRTRGAAANLSPQETLEQLLQGTGLRYEFINDRTVAIRPETSETSEKISAAEANNAAAARGELEEILVTGSHIRGGKEPAAPTQVITRTDIEKTGYTSLEGLLEELPQNFASISPEGSLSEHGGRMAVGNAVARGASVDLRGLGPESTLTLVNGRRIAAGSAAGKVVDISVIPLSMIERVEVVSGGQSAIYGADAVAGVVNFVTRRDFNGLETQVTHGFSPEHSGGDRLQVSQLAGFSGERFGLAAVYDYSHTDALNLGDLGLLRDHVDMYRPMVREAVSDASVHSVFLSGRYAATDTVEIVADAFYSQRDSLGVSSSWYDGAPRASQSLIDFVNDQYGAVLGVEVDLGRDWAVNVTGSMGQAGTSYVMSDDVSYSDFEFDFSTDVEQDVSTRAFTAIADGSLPQMLGFTPRLAVGVEYREDEVKTVSTRTTRLDRSLKSAFSELLLPIVTNGGPGLRALEVSVAARYDEYDDLGSTFNPQGGIVWHVSNSFKLQASYTEAFRAPAMADLNSSGFHSVVWRDDPVTGDPSPVLFLGGTKSGLRPETAQSWSVGFELTPEFARRTRLSASYFAIDYQDRLERPIISSAEDENMLVNAGFYAQQLTRNPTAADVAAAIASDTDGRIDNLTGVALNPDGSNLLSVFPDLIIFDNRTANVAVQKYSGLDFGANVEWDAAQSLWSAGLNATYTLQHDRYLTATSPAIEAMDGVGKPVRFRVRANLGWSRGAWGAYLYANFTEGYANQMPMATRDVSSWTTLNASLRFDGSAFGQGSAWNGLSATLSADNLLDKDPPFVTGMSGDGLLYDPMNANAIGRFVTVRLTKRW